MMQKLIITFFNENESKHESLVSPVRPGHLVELGNQLLFGLAIDDEDDGATAGLEKPDHSVVGFGTKFVDLQLRDYLALLVNLLKNLKNLTYE
jgi:hypothetical protein